MAEPYKMKAHYLTRKESIMQFGKNLKELRAKQNITQEALAEKVGISRQMIARYESGENYPEMDKAIEIAKVLNCKLDDLVNGKDFAQNFTPLITQNVSVKIEKPRMTRKDKIKYSILWCFVSLWVCFAFAIGVSQIADGPGEITTGFILPLMFASWFAIVIYFKSK